MPKFQVEIIQQVSDIVRGFIEVGAENADAAAEKVEQMIEEDDPSLPELHFWQCADSITGREVSEVTEVK